MTAMSRSGFAHRAHPWTKPTQPSLLTQAVKARHEYVAPQITSRGWPHVME